MEPSCIRHTELPNTTKLFADFLYHPERLERFYPYLPASPESFRRAAEQIRFSDEQRAGLIGALQLQNAGNPLLDRLAQPGTVAVMTGQQVGLFSGPAFTVYKALAAIRLAERLSDDGIPAVPVFWTATEDHDFHEVNQAWLLDAEHRPERFEAVARIGPHQPVGEAIIESVPFDEIRRVLATLRFGEEAFSLIRDTYRPGRTFGEAFGELLDRLLHGFPILRVDPMLPAFRQLASPLLRDAVLRAPELTLRIRERDRELKEFGYHSQVHVEDSTSLVFLLEGGERLALRRQNGQYVLGKRKISAAELADRASELSPNALLRPVVQDFMLPTVAYVGGPAELAYFAQSEVLYRELLGRQPVAVHRSSFTLIDHHQSRVFDRYGLTLPDFTHGEEYVKDKAAAAIVPPGLVARVAEARSTAVSSLGRMSTEVEQFDRSIAKALENSRRKIEYQFGKIERKVRREALVRDELATRDVAQLSASVFPRHRLQERLYSMVGLIAQHGPDLVARLYDHVTLECPDHQLLVI